MCVCCVCFLSRSWCPWFTATILSRVANGQPKYTKSQTRIGWYCNTVNIQKGYDDTWHGDHAIWIQIQTLSWSCLIWISKLLSLCAKQSASHGATVLDKWGRLRTNDSLLASTSSHSNPIPMQKSWLLFRIDYSLETVGKESRNPETLEMDGNSITVSWSITLLRYSYILVSSCFINAFQSVCFICLDFGLIRFPKSLSLTPWHTGLLHLHPFTASRTVSGHVRTPQLDQTLLTQIADQNESARSQGDRIWRVPGSVQNLQWLLICRFFIVQIYPSTFIEPILRVKQLIACSIT